MDSSADLYEGAEYSSFWDAPEKTQTDLIERRIVTAALPGGDSIVDVGAGFGRLVECYLESYRDIHIVEPASNLRAQARSRYGDRISYHDASVYQLPFADESLDAVVMVRVLHHLHDAQAAILELARILKPGGRLVFNYSNKRNLLRIVKSAGGSAGNPFSRADQWYNDIQVGHHPRTIRDILRSSNLKPVRLFGVGFEESVVKAMPALAPMFQPSLTRSRAVAILNLAPANFVVAVKS